MPLSRCCMGSDISHTSEEEKYVLPPPCNRMDRHDPDPLAPLEQASSHGVGAGESGHGPGTLVCPDRCQCVPGGGSGCACCAWCIGRSHGRGRSSCWPIVACMPVGCFGASPAWAGIPFCASIPAGRFVPKATCVGCR